MRRLLTIIIAICSCFVAWGQATVSGRIFDMDSKEGVVGAIVEITSPSSLFALTFAPSIALIAQGSLRFAMLPVTNER